MSPDGDVYSFLHDEDYTDFIWGPWDSGAAALDAFLFHGGGRDAWPVVLGEGIGPSFKSKRLSSKKEAPAFEEGLGDIKLI
jgi:hypothetical protein